MKRTILSSMIVLAVCLSTLVRAHPVTAQSTLVDLGTLGGNESLAFDINNRGQVVGRSNTAAGETHAFLWENGTMIDLGTADGYFWFVTALAINDKGQVVGQGISNEGNRAFLWEKGKMTVLGTLGGCCSVAEDINDKGIVVGSARISNGSFDAFRYRKGNMEDLGTLGGSYSSAAAINDKGWIAGYSEVTPGFDHAAIWRQNEWLDLGTLGGSTAWANGINRWGDAVGGSISASGEVHAFLWKDGVMVDLTPNSDAGYSNAKDINRSGQVTGEGYLPPHREYLRAFLWEEGVFTDIGTLGGLYSQAEAINDLGQVVGYSYLDNGYQHAFIWTNDSALIK